MTGIDMKRGLVVQPRDMKLLGELAIMRVVDREQAKIVAGFGSTTRANARLLALTRAGLLRRFFLGSRKSLYALSEKGAQLAEVPLRGPRRKANEMLVADRYGAIRLGWCCATNHGYRVVAHVCKMASGRSMI